MYVLKYLRIYKDKSIKNKNKKKYFLKEEHIFMRNIFLKNNYQINKSHATAF